MKLTSQQRRDVIEELLDIKVFSDMSKNLKIKISNSKLELDQLVSDIKSRKDRVTLKESYIKSQEEDKSSKISILEDRLNLITNEYNILNDKIQILKSEIDAYVGIRQTGPTFVKLDAVTTMVSQSKNIVKTQVQGRNSTIKEYISDNDYDITIKGVITSEAIRHSPDEDLENLLNLMSLPNEIVIVSNYLALFKIQYVVVESFNISQIEGYTNQVAIDIKLISDEPIELKLGIDPNA
mgnify:CR=1 FL=1